MWSLSGLLALVLGGSASTSHVLDNDNYEYVTFTPPPTWSVVNTAEMRQYVRSDQGSPGVIKLFASRPATGTAAQIFTELWRAEAAKVVIGPSPTPAVHQVGDVTLAAEAKQVQSQGTPVRVVVTVIVLRGRSLGIVGMAVGAQRIAELDAFIKSLDVAQSSPTVTTPPEPSNGSTNIGFDVPPGYVQQRTGDVIVLSPATVNERTPCVYGIAATRAASGNLEADAASALTESVVPGWRRLDDWHSAMRGTSAAGWPYVWYRAAFEGEMGGQRGGYNVMAMVLPAGAGRVHVVWGMGSIVQCLLDDVSFEALFHSLRPSGWTSDKGEALTRDLRGAWRYTASAGLQQFVFMADGRYDRDVGSRAQVGVMERTSATATGGRYVVQDGELTLTADHRPQNPDRYRVRVYDEWFQGQWKRSMALFDQRANPPRVVQYYRIDDNQR